jgi:predicted methyltransferase
VSFHRINCVMYAEVRRVLRPGGVYLFVEHVAAKGV